MITKELIEDVLEELNESPLGILLYTGTTAASDPAFGDSCPVAQYLKATFPGQHDVYVGEYTTRVGSLRVRTPAAVRRFIQNFDRGRHPELKYQG